MIQRVAVLSVVFVVGCSSSDGATGSPSASTSPHASTSAKPSASAPAVASSAPAAPSVSAAPSAAAAGPTGKNGSIVANVRVGAVSAAGIDEKAVKDVMTPLGDTFKACYQDLLAKTPKVTGSTTIRVTLGKDGEILKVEVTSTALGDETYLACVKGTVEKAKFPKPTKEAAAFTYPIVSAPEAP